MLLQYRRGKLFKGKLDSEKVSVSILHYNNLKMRLENAERINVFLECSGSLWETECLRKKKDVSKALVSSECGPS